MKKLSRTVLAIATAALCTATLAQAQGASAEAQTRAQFAKEANGLWQSLTCELRPQAGQDGKVQPWYLKRSMKIKGDQVDAEFVTYADGACQAPLWKLEFGATATDAGA